MTAHVEREELGDLGFAAPPVALRELVGPEAPFDLLGAAVRLEERPLHAGPCELDGDAVRWCRALAGGGVVLCGVHGCGRPVFIAPDTCLERVLEEADLGVVRRRS